MVDAVSRSGLALERHEPSLKIRGVRLQNPILDVVAFCAAHGEEAAAFQLEDLAAHQMQHMRANAVYPASVPLVHGVSFQCVIVFVVTADEGKREGQAFQPVQRFIVAAVTKPHAAEVSCDDDRVILRHVSLFREVFLLKPCKISVAVTGHKYHFSISYLSLICSGGSRCRS
jgi:hypothetical protein